MTELYIGVMSGTSMDGVDAVLLQPGSPPLVAGHHYHAYDATLKQELLELCQPGEDEIERLAIADQKVAEVIAATTNTLVQQCETGRHAVTAIGSHGQTIRHAAARYSLQIGDPNRIAELTGITTVADFRRKDIAAGGQGAPFAPAFHKAVFAAADKSRAIVNIGGMANITVLAPGQPCIGYDTGPGNVLSDAWTQQHIGKPFDAGGEWARQGTVRQDLLTRLLAENYFKRPFPKSTGRELFNLNWLQQQLGTPRPAAVDVQRTLLELSAVSIRDAIVVHGAVDEVYVCGGGANNQLLMERLQTLTPANRVTTTGSLGMAPELVEASAFAWFAQQAMQQQPVDLCSVTGARNACVLGGIYYA